MQPLLQALHWLPVQARIDYKLSTLCHNFFSDSAPAYLCDILTVYIPSRQLRSYAHALILRIPPVRTKTFGQHCFTCCAPKQRNSLPSDIRHIQFSYNYYAFKTRLYKQYNNKLFQIKKCLRTCIPPSLTTANFTLPHSSSHSFCASTQGIIYIT